MTVLEAYPVSSETWRVRQLSGGEGGAVIELRMIEGRCCPVVMCDRCGEQITEGHANVEWREWRKAGPVDFRVVHKPHECAGPYDRRAELKAWPYWQELTHTLLWLIENTGIDLDAARETDALLRGL